MDRIAACGATDPSSILGGRTKKKTVSEFVGCAYLGLDIGCPIFTIFIIQYSDFNAPRHGDKGLAKFPPPC